MEDEYNLFFLISLAKIIHSDTLLTVYLNLLFFEFSGLFSLLWRSRGGGGGLWLAKQFTTSGIRF